MSPLAWAIFVVGFVFFAGTQVWFNHVEPWLARATRVVTGPPSAEPGIGAVATVPPLAWPVRELLLGLAVEVINPPGSGCEQVELTPRQLKDLSFADFAVTVGFGLDDGVREALERRRTAPPAVISLESVVRSSGETIEGAHDHDHDEAGHAHEHAALDPHAWLDPIVMKGLVNDVAGELSGLRFADPFQIADRAAKLRAICDEIDAEYRTRLGPIADKRIIVQHNAFSYLARRYGLTIEAVTRPRHDVEPTPGDLADAARRLREKQVRVIFVDPPGPDEATKRIAEAAGARVLVLDPLGDGDWPALMRRNLDALVEGLTPADGGGKPAP